MEIAEKQDRYSLKGEVNRSKFQGELNSFRLFIDLSFSSFSPFYSVPYSFVKKVAYCGIDITHNHKAHGNLYLPCKQVDCNKIKN